MHGKHRCLQDIVSIDFFRAGNANRPGYGFFTNDCSPVQPLFRRHGFRIAQRNEGKILRQDDCRRYYRTRQSPSARLVDAGLKYAATRVLKPLYTTLFSKRSPHYHSTLFMRNNCIFYLCGKISHFMKKIDPGTIPTFDFHQFILGSVAPRPIAFVSTLDENGNPNLAPYSFFNAFSSNPPVLIFSSNRRVQDNTTKDTLHNIEATRQCVINVVTYSMVRKMAVASVEFPPQVNEFEKAGFTPIPSDLVRPPRVKESPVHFECEVFDIRPLGEHGGAGNLVFCRVLRMHIDPQIIDHRGRIDPHRIDLMGRMGRSYYVRCSGEAIYTVVQPVTQLVIGYDALPDSVKTSDVLTANDIGLLAGLTAWPDTSRISRARQRTDVQRILQSDQSTESRKRALHQIAHTLLQMSQRELAAAVLTIADTLEEP